MIRRWSKIKYLLIIVCNSIFFVVSGQNINDSGYIKISYKGEVDKPYPSIVFYLRDFGDTTINDFFVYKFKISNVEFNSISKIIETHKPSKRPELLANFCEFSIKINDLSKTFVSNDKIFIGEISNAIVKEFENKPEENPIRNSFCSFDGRLGIRPDFLCDMPRRKHSNSQ